LQQLARLFYFILLQRVRTTEIKYFMQVILFQLFYFTCTTGFKLWFYTGVPRRQPQCRSGLATLTSVGAIP